MKLLSFLSIICLALLSCGDDNGANGQEPQNVSISCSPSNVEFTKDGGKSIVLVTVIGSEWTVEADKNDWLTVTVSKISASSANVTIAAQPNTTTEKRTCNVTVTANAENKKVINVTQAPKEKYDGEEVNIVTPEGYTLVWHDEFSEEGSLSSDWTHEVQKAGWVNNELQNYVRETSPSGRKVTELVAGHLAINCFEEDGKVYSGRVYAKVDEGWKYGYFEARIKLPSGKGTWPAYWMMPVGNDWSTNPWPKCGEIDIMEEVGCVPNEVSSSIHTQDYNHTIGTQKTHAMNLADAEGAYHVYALEWTEDAITTYVDGKVQLAVTKKELGSDHNQWPFHYAFYPILNLAWGGMWGGMNGVDPSALPVTMEVDYVRIFQKK